MSFRSKFPILSRHDVRNPPSSAGQPKIYGSGDFTTDISKPKYLQRINNANLFEHPDVASTLLLSKWLQQNDTELSTQILQQTNTHTGLARSLVPPDHPSSVIGSLYRPLPREAEFLDPEHARMLKQFNSMSLSLHNHPNPRTLSPSYCHARCLVLEENFVRRPLLSTSPCLLFDFFKYIEHWCATYTVPIRVLSAEQVHSLAAVLNKLSQIMMLLTEKDILIVMVAGVVSRHMWAHALDEHSLYASGDPNVKICEDLSYRWTCLGAEKHQAKHDSLLY
ncbi:hypothetical protein EJ02DRAFT_429870 [Clathrospora elynae]|uniref:Uncharacterized protein n=1 Tax=Clathrospora elynae TaxID=706981 RepID=A0A6A5T5S1_9PLEO|nr:hypothetical protein EJ02DRAFT_429870 [Clathrospora elynae]